MLAPAEDILPSNQLLALAKLVSTEGSELSKLLRQILAGRVHVVKGREHPDGEYFTIGYSIEDSSSRGVSSRRFPVFMSQNLAENAVANSTELAGFLKTEEVEALDILRTISEINPPADIELVFDPDSEALYVNNKLLREIFGNSESEQIEGVYGTLSDVQLSSSARQAILGIIKQYPAIKNACLVSINNCEVRELRMVVCLAADIPMHLINSSLCIVAGDNAMECDTLALAAYRLDNFSEYQKFERCGTNLI